MTKYDIFTWSENVAEEVYGWVEGVEFDECHSLYEWVCYCLKDTDASVDMYGSVEELEIEIIFEVLGNGVNVVLLFNNSVNSEEMLTVEMVTTSKVTLTL